MILLPCASLHDPWASLVVDGEKTLETRKGSILSGFSGVLVIHRTLARCVDYDLSRWGLRVPPRPPGWPEDDRGMALGVVYIERTWRPGELIGRTDTHVWIRDGHTEAGLQRRACFDDIHARYLSEISHAAWFPAPFPATGKQSRFQVEVPRGHLPAWALAT